MRSPYLFLLLLTGCPGADKDDTGGTGVDDSGDTDVTYESGCITIDGGGGYAKIADAITLAPEGAVIELCAGIYEEGIVIDKSVTVRGASMDSVFINGPGVDIPITVTGADVTVENVTVNSPRTGITLSGATNATLTNINVATAGSWGLSASASTATIDGLSLTEPPSGGVEVSGGEVTLTNLTVEYPAGFGIWASDGAIVDVDTATITGTLLLSDDVTTDGHAVHIDDADVTLTNVTVDGAEGMGIAAQDATVNIVDSTITDAVYLGIYAFDSAYDISGLTLSGSGLEGIYATGTTFTMAASTISADSKTSCSYTYDEWGGDNAGPWCGGMLIIADDVSLTDVNVSGWNNYAYYVAPNTADLATLSINGGTIDDVGRWGAYLASVDATVSGLTVTNMRDDEIVTAGTLCYYVDRAVGLLGVESTIVADGLTLENNVGWGMVNLFGSADISGSTFTAPGCANVCNYQGSTSVTGSNLTGPAEYSIYDQEGVLVLDGNTFTNGHADSFYSYEYDGVTYEYGYDSGQGRDIYSYSSATVSVTNNTFTDGDASLVLSSPGEVTISGNTWTDYESYIAYIYDAASTSPVVFTDNAVDDVVGPVIYAYSAFVEAENVSVGTTRISAPMTYYSYADGVLQYSYSYQSSASAFQVYGYYYDDGTSVTDMPGALSLQDITVAESYGTLISASDAELDVSGLEAGAVGGYGISASWSSYAPDVEVEDLSITSTTSAAFYLYNSYADGYGSATFSDTSVSTVGGDGFYSMALGGLDLTDVTFGSVASNGVNIVSRTYDYSYVYDSTTGSYIYTYYDLDSDTELVVDGLTIESVGSDGIYQQGGSAQIAATTITDAGSDGLSFQGVSPVSATSTTLASPGSYGVYSTDSYSTYSYEESAYVTIDADTSVALDGVTVTGAGASGMSFTGGSVTMSNSTIDGSASDGLALSGVTVDVQTNTFLNNGSYGMTCTDVTLSVCATNTGTDNVSGNHLDCWDSCFE
jgi:hypothetical protein